mmetsp:Transcript_29045/g.72922  ORF Transcript_29045/g.72922 Transcript_29045/m.72922 type:complete len:205 (+) Transcript_29045:497-1111(+)
MCAATVKVARLFCCHQGHRPCHYVAAVQHNLLHCPVLQKVGVNLGCRQLPGLKLETHRKGIVRVRPHRLYQRHAVAHGQIAPYLVRQVELRLHALVHPPDGDLAMREDIGMCAQAFDEEGTRRALPSHNHKARHWSHGPPPGHHNNCPRAKSGERRMSIRNRAQRHSIHELQYQQLKRCAPPSLARADTERHRPRNGAPDTSEE